MEQVSGQLDKVKDSVKESLLGAEVEPGTELSGQTRAEFMQYAVKDDESGEYYMNADQFVQAVAPAGEDYVSFDAFRSLLCRPLFFSHCFTNWERTSFGD